MNYLTGLLLATCIAHAYACSCAFPQPTEQEKFCKTSTKFVVLVYIKSTATNDAAESKLKYRVRLDETYKSNVTGSIRNNFVYTATDSAQCGITNLVKDKYYILSGSYFDCGNKKCMYIAQCTSIVNKYDTSPDYTAPTCPTK